MRQRNVKNQDEIVNNSSMYKENINEFKGKWKKTFKYKKIELEIGIGKGNFIYNKAKENKDTLYIGIELSKSVIALAIKKINLLSKGDNIDIQNIILSTYNAENLNEVFDSGEVDKLYLNFSDPWPKAKHEKRRLTSPKFIDIYENVLANNATIEFKTDNRLLFEYTIKTLSLLEIKIEYLTLDLHKDIELKRYEGHNILTEYEEKYMDKGPIYLVIFSLKRGET